MRGNHDSEAKCTVFNSGEILRLEIARSFNSPYTEKLEKNHIPVEIRGKLGVSITNK